MPRILRIINRLNLGGPTLNAAYLSRYLAPEFETLLVAGMIDETEASSSFITAEMGLHPVLVPEMYREIHPVRDLSALRRLKKIITGFQPDIVHTHAAKAGALGRWAAFDCKVPVIVHTFHGHIFHSYFPRWKSGVFVEAERYLAKKSSRIITVSEKLKKELSDNYHICPPGKIEVIPLGFDLQKFTANIPFKRKKFRDRYQLSDEEVVIAIIGRLVPVKNHRLFLNGIKQLTSLTQKPIRAFIVGDGEMRQELQQLASDLELDFTFYSSDPRQATITFTSWIKEVDEVYAGADIIALTSLNEGTPVTLIEAQAVGKSIVATDVGGIGDIVVPSETVILVRSNDKEAFAKALLQLVEKNPGSYQKEISESTIRQFSYQRLVRDMSALYLRLLSES